MCEVDVSSNAPTPFYSWVLLKCLMRCFFFPPRLFTYLRYAVLSVKLVTNIGVGYLEVPVMFCRLLAFFLRECAQTSLIRLSKNDISLFFSLFKNFCYLEIY
jgi:hypothetical protein